MKTDYEKAIDKIIAKKLPIEDTLIEMLEEASNWKEVNGKLIKICDTSKVEPREIAMKTN